MDPKIFQLSITPKGQKEIYSVKLTKGMYTYTLKLTRHLEHFFLSYYRFKIGAFSGL